LSVVIIPVWPRCSHEYHKETLDNLREASRMTGKLCAVLLDTKGPEIRTGTLKGGQVRAEDGHCSVRRAAGRRRRMRAPERARTSAFFCQ